MVITTIDWESKDVEAFIRIRDSLNRRIEELTFSKVAEYVEGQLNATKEE